MDISRRQLAAVVLASTAAAQAQEPQPAGDVDTARLQQRAAAQIIAQVALPMTTEPAFQFKA